MTKGQNRKLIQLKKEKSYEKILKQFRQRKYRKQDIAKLKKEGKFEDIYIKYGENYYNKLLNEFKQREIEEIYGKKSLKAKSHKIKAIIKLFLLNIGNISSIGSTTIGALSAELVGITVIESELIKNENKKQYKDLIEEYENKIVQYAKNINKMNLTDLEIFMKIQEDMHNSIIGYGTPNLDIEGYFGIDIVQEEGRGVCKNMADYFVCQLNAINPDYNARAIIVRATQFVDFETTDIKKNTESNISKKFDKFNYTAIRNMTKTIVKTTQRDEIYNILGNHVVVAVDLKKENITLIVDPTKLIIGVFKDGKITIFNPINKENQFNMYRTLLDDFAYRGIGAFEIPNEYIKSFLNPFVTINELNDKYGIEAQQKSLKSARKKEENYIYKCSKEKNFKNYLQVDLQNEDIYSIEEIKMEYNKCKELINNLNTVEQAIELKDIYEKILYSIEYYDKKQEEIIGKSVNYYAKISKRLNLDLRLLSKEIIKGILSKINERKELEQIEDVYNNIERITEER